MQIVNSKTAYPIGQQWEDVNGIGMKGWPEKQGWSFSRAGYLAARDDPTIDADKFGAMLKRQLRPLSLPTLVKARAEYAAREVVKFPRYFIIEPTAVCNRRCPFCSILVTNRKGMMSWDTFSKLMNECGKHDVFGISLYQLGEPFLWHGKEISQSGSNDQTAWTVYGSQNISHMVNYAKQVGGFKTVNLSTNGDVKNLDVILGSQLDDLIISIDGTTAEVYNANRPSTTPNDTGAFDRTIERVMTFLEHKAARGEAKPWVRLQIINKENTHDQVIPFIKQWIEVPGVDDVLCKNLDSMGAWLKGVVSDEEAAQKMTAVKSMPCQHIYAVGSMVADGGLNACCHDARTELTTSGANINSMTFADWWNGQYMTDLRKEHEGGAVRLPCAACAERDPWLG